MFETKTDSQGVKYGKFRGGFQNPIASIVGVENLKSSIIIIPETISVDFPILDNNFKETKSTRTIHFKVVDCDYGVFKDNKDIKKVHLPDTITEIGRSMFDHCSSLYSVNIPMNVKKIGEYAFDSCTSLKDCVIPDGVKEIGMNAFQYCETLTSIVIPNSVMDLGEETFCHCKNLKSIIVSDNVKILEKDTFAFCGKLEYIKLGKNIQHIDRRFLSFCYNLKTVDCTGVSTLVRQELREALGNANSGVDKWVHIRV